MENDPTAKTAPHGVAPFRLPDSAHPRVESFYQLWRQLGQGQVPRASAFDLGRLRTDFPFLARIGVEGPGSNLFWRDVPHGQIWPFSTPVAGGPVIGSAPQPVVLRVVDAFHRTLERGIPDYFETTSWMHDGRTLAIARLVAPVVAASGMELILMWEMLEPRSSPGQGPELPVSAKNVLSL